LELKSHPAYYSFKIFRGYPSNTRELLMHCFSLNKM